MCSDVHTRSSPMVSTRYAKFPAQAEFCGCRAKLRQPLRAGYIGQMTNLANRLISLSLERELISSYLSREDTWEPWVRDVLEPTNKVGRNWPQDNLLVQKAIVLHDDWSQATFGKACTIWMGCS